jgi:DNA-binding CsgD family transcriptional regulator
LETGLVQLTRRGREVAELVAQGLSNRAIAERLVLSERTVEWHVEQILNRLGFSSRSQIAAWLGRTDADSLVTVPGAQRRGNLPAELATFVGRDRELDRRGVQCTGRLQKETFAVATPPGHHCGRAVGRRSAVAGTVRHVSAPITSI